MEFSTLVWLVQEVRGDNPKSLLASKSVNKETANISMTSHKNRLIITKRKDQKNEKVGFAY